MLTSRQLDKVIAVPALAGIIGTSVALSPPVPELLLHGFQLGPGPCCALILRPDISLMQPQPHLAKGSCRPAAAGSGPRSASWRPAAQQAKTACGTLIRRPCSSGPHCGPHCGPSDC